jgi:hypothetical protein
MNFSERATRNEEVFRSVNERIEQGGEQHGVTSPMPFHCECDRESCFETVELLPRVYRTIAEERYRFLIVPGHEDPRIERVVDLHREHPQERHRNA